MLKYFLLRAAIAALACVLAGVATAEPLEPDEAVASEREGEVPLDVALPSPAPGAGKVDPSKFTAALAAAQAWSGKLGVDSGPSSTWPAAAAPWPEPLLSGADADRSSGVAWANMTATAPQGWDKMAIESRVDPQQQGTFGVTLSRSVPIGGDLSMTWQNSHAVMQSFNHGVAAGDPQVYSTNQAVRFTILPADTTLSVGATHSSADAKWAHSLSAEQKLFGGPVSVTGALSESASGDISRSIKAGFKRTW